jgi:PAS domain S-box-containing protein
MAMSDPAVDVEALRRELAALRARTEILPLILDESTDPIFAILEDGTYRYVNQAFAAPFGKRPQEIIGKRIYDVFPPDEAEKRMVVVRQAFATGETVVFDVRVPLPSGDIFFITSVKPIKDEAGQVRFVICISKDITERKKSDEERERLIADLQHAVTKIRTLSGMFPICASCKKIRDDRGYWTQIEEYIRDHSEAEFSHGICPECATRLYPGIKIDEP